MAINYLNIACTQVGPGSYSYNTAAYPAGATIYVNSATGVDGKGHLFIPGTAPSLAAAASATQGPYNDPGKPMASVFGTAGALTACGAGRGDTIIVAPGHSENLATGTAIKIPSGVTIIGAGYGSLRPKFVFTNASTFIQPDTGGGVSIQNCIFDLTGVAALTKAFLVNVTGVQFYNCRMIQSGTSNQATDCIVLNAGGDDCLIVQCEIDATAAAGAARAISNPASNNIVRLQVLNSFLHGDFSAQPISLLSTGTAQFIIADNWLRNFNASANCVGLAAGNTILGMITDNRIMMAGTGNTTFISGGGGTGIALLQNFAWDTAASTHSGILLPAAGTP